MTTEHRTLRAGANAGGSDALSDSSAGSLRTQRKCRRTEIVQIKNSAAVPLKSEIAHMA